LTCAAKFLYTFFVACQTRSDFLSAAINVVAYNSDDDDDDGNATAALSAQRRGTRGDKTSGREELEERRADQMARKRVLIPRRRARTAIDGGVSSTSSFYVLRSGRFLHAGLDIRSLPTPVAGVGSPRFRLITDVLIDENNLKNPPDTKRLDIFEHSR